MTWRAYLMPVTGTGTRSDPRIPKYASEVIGWSAEIYGQENWCILAADTDSTQDTTLTGHTDVRGIPAALDAVLTSGAVTTVSNALETANIPAQWVNTSRSYRDVLRIVHGIFQLTQRVNGKGFRFLSAATLDDTIGSLPAASRQAMNDACAELGFSTTGITLTTTIREALRLIGIQMLSTQYTLGGLVV